MNIPREAIEKAIEVGWKPRNFVNIPDLEYTVKGNSDNWQDVALDPSFWQALGKALGWDTEITWWRCPLETCKENNSKWAAQRYCGEDGYKMEQYKTYTENWQKYARCFYDLILTGDDTAAFWRELLK